MPSPPIRPPIWGPPGAPETASVGGNGTCGGAVGAPPLTGSENSLNQIRAPLQAFRMQGWEDEANIAAAAAEATQAAAAAAAKNLYSPSFWSHGGMWSQNTSVLDAGLWGSIGDVPAFIDLADDGSATVRPRLPDTKKALAKELKEVVYAII